MRKSICLSVILLIAVSCTTKLRLPEEPQVTQGVSVVTVAIPSFQLIDDVSSQVIPGKGTHRWSNSENLGIFSDDGTNARFILRKEYDGAVCEEAEFYGEPMYGTLTGCLPWSKSPAAGGVFEQKYHADAYAHFISNSLLSGVVKDARLSLEYSGGLLRLNCSEDLGVVESVRIYAGEWEAVVGDVDMKCDAVSPLTVWVNIPAGKYSNFNVTFNCNGRRVSIPAPGDFVVTDFHCVSVKVEQKTYYDGIDPFTGEEAEYSDKPEDY